MMKNINWADHLFNFLAVILGVSLAFFVNDNAETKKRQEEYNQVIDSFLEEFRSDLDTYEEYQIPDNKNQLRVISDVLKLINTGQSDSLVEKFSKAISINNYFPSSVTFSSLQSTGKLDLIEDFELRKELSNYHTVLAEEARIRGQIQVDFYMNQLMPWIIKNTDFSNPSVEPLQDPELKNLLIIYQSFILNKVTHYQFMTKRIGWLENKFLELNPVSE